MQKFLAEAQENKYRYDEYEPHVPNTIKLDFHSPEIHELEKIGREEIKKGAFCLVAGGLGERLGYNGIKLDIEIELITN